MTKMKLLRITGVLFSLLIIASVFLPYNNVNNQPLFSLNNTKELLLPIIIMVFGLISLVLYFTNYYCEFPLSTSGAVLFFVIIETVYAISNKTLSEFGIGYYMLVAGSVFLFMNTIVLLIINIRNKSSKQEENSSNETVTTDLDKLYSPQYNDTPITNNAMIYEQPIVQPVQPIVEPVQPVVAPVEPVVPIQEPVQPIVEPVQQNNAMVYEQPIAEPVYEPIQELNPIVDTQVAQPVQPLPEIQFEQMPEYKQPITPLYEEPKEVRPEDNIALKSLLEPSSQVGSVEPVNPVNDFNQPVNPVLNEFTQQPVTQEVQQPVNPVLNEFAQQPVNPVNDFNQSVNPVLQQFDQPMSFIGQPVQQPQPQVQPEQPQQPNEGIGMSIFNNH